MKRVMFLMVLALMLVGLTTGCGKQDCVDQMQDTKAKYGAAEEINRYNSKDYHNEDWWYWSRGFEYSFTWGENIKGCDVSKYTFSPIGSTSLSTSTKIVAEKSKVLVERFFCPGTSLPTQ